MTRHWRALGGNAYAGKILAQIPAGYSVNAAGFLVRDADGAAIGTPQKDATGAITAWVDANGNRIAGAGFGGYDPNAPPPGYDPICWRGNNYDWNHGLVCRVQADGSTKLENVPIGAWLPWTADLGATAPPADSAAGYLIATGQILPHPGPLTQAQAQALYASVGPRADGMSADDFLAEVARIRNTVDVQHVASDAAKELQQVLADIGALSEARDNLAAQIQAGGSGNPFVWTHAFGGTAADLTRLNALQKQLDALHDRARVLQGLPPTVRQITTPPPVDYVPPPPVDFGPVPDDLPPFFGPGETLGPTGEVEPAGFIPEEPTDEPPNGAGGPPPGAPNGGGGPPPGGGGGNGYTPPRPRTTVLPEDPTEGAGAGASRTPLALAGLGIGALLLFARRPKRKS